jgi:hypothetical protein
MIASNRCSQLWRRFPAGVAASNGSRRRMRPVQSSHERNRGQTSWNENFALAPLAFAERIAMI